MKRILSVIIILLLLLCSCSPASKNPKDTSSTAGSSSDMISNESSASSASGSGTSSASSSSTTSAGAQSSKPGTSSKSSSTGVASQMNRELQPEDTAQSLGVTKEMIEKSVYSEGNRARLAAVIKKAKRGEEITIGFLGGSITDGSNVPAGKSYARLVEKWWLNKFLKTKINYVNAGIGATGSIIGVHRADKDLLTSKPDFVILEYSVNDGTDQETKEAYESLVRKILNSEQKPALLLLFMCTSGGGGAQDLHSQIGTHYDLPMISYRDGCSVATKSGLFPWSKFTTDTVHPNVFGYATCGLFVNTYLNQVYNQLDKIKDTEKAMPAALTGDVYKNTKILGNQDITPKSMGDFKPVSNALYFYKNGWEVTSGTKPIIFSVEAKRVTLLYKRDITNTKGTAVVTVNDEPMCYLNGHFKDGWGDVATTKIVADFTAKKKLTVSVGMADGETKGFTLAAIYIAY